MHNRVLLTRWNGRVESFKNIKSIKAAQDIVDKRGKNFTTYGQRVIRFTKALYYNSNNEKHKLKI